MAPIRPPPVLERHGPIPFVPTHQPGVIGPNSDCGETAWAALSFGYASVNRHLNSKGLKTASDRIDFFRSLSGRKPGAGLTPHQMRRLGEDVGLRTHINVDSSRARIEAQLGKGFSVILEGNYWALPWHQNSERASEHYIVATRQLMDGRFRVLDGDDSRGLRPRFVHWDVLKTFLHGAAGNKNWGASLRVG
jgi:hypothetical protein